MEFQLEGHGVEFFHLQTISPAGSPMLAETTSLKISKIAISLMKKANDKRYDKKCGAHTPGVFGQRII